MTQSPYQANDIGAEANELREVIRSVAEEEGFSSFELDLREDSTAVPAVYISFFVQSADAPTAADLDAVKRLRMRVVAALFDYGIRRTPYIRFRKAPERAD